MITRTPLNSPEWRLPAGTFSYLINRDRRTRSGTSSLASRRTTRPCSIVQPETHLSTVYERAGLAMRHGVYHIAIWWWETDVVPEHWKLASKSIDELWAGSGFIVDSLHRTLDVPVRHIPLGFELGPVRQVDLGSYGVPAGSFVFLFIFDFRSTLERKNPLGLISAFKQAFQSGEKVSLIIKVSYGASHPEDFHRLQKEAKQVGAIVIDQRLPREEIIGLIAACECYVSLHRSEGLGATLAEAMMLGKPCIATAYSGNLDFMDDNNSLLIDYQLTEIEETVGLYEKGHRWAEPSIPQAANAMRWVFEHPEEARLLGEHGTFFSTSIFLAGAMRPQDARTSESDSERAKRKEPGGAAGWEQADRGCPISGERSPTRQYLFRFTGRSPQQRSPWMQGGHHRLESQLRPRRDLEASSTLVREQDPQRHSAGEVVAELRRG